MANKTRSDETTPFWRKIFSSNWWWYGEVNPDPARLPPPEKRPKLWRRDAILAIGFVPVGTLIFYLSAELNSRYWPFNHSQPYEGVILVTRDSDRQLFVQLTDTTRMEIGFPFADTMGIQRQVNWRSTLWADVLKKLIEGHYQCPDRRLRFYGETWKFTFRPVVRVWRVDCASSNAILVNEQMIQHRWRAHLGWKFKPMVWISLGFSLFGLILIVHRERKLYVKSRSCGCLRDECWYQSWSGEHWCDRQQHCKRAGPGWAGSCAIVRY